MTNNLPEKYQENTLSQVDYMHKMCSALMKQKHYARIGEEVIFTILQKAKTLNIDPLDALGGALYSINGKIGMSSEMMACLIRQAGHSIMKDPKSDHQKCILNGRRADNGDTWIVSFSMEDARRAGLVKNIWEKYPAIMLYNRCMSMLARQLFPDVIKGAGYTHEELMEIKPHNRPGEIVDIKYDVEIEKISSEQAEELNDIISECSDKYKDTVATFFKKSGLSSIYDLPVDTYKKLRFGAETKRKEYEEQKKRENSLFGQDEDTHISVVELNDKKTSGDEGE